MPDSSLPMMTLSISNRAIDCLTLSCSDWAIRPDLGQFLDLPITLTFGQQRDLLLEGWVQYALKGGQLKLDVTQGRVTPNSDALMPYGHLVTSSIAHSLWRLTPPARALLLEGTLADVSLGSLNPTEGGMALAIAFEVDTADLTLTQTENLWPHDLHPNCHTILERVLCHWLRETRLVPYLSRLQLGQLPSSDLPIVSPSRWDDFAVDSIKTTINRLYHERDRNLIHLAKLAHLNPFKDLAGGDFTATDLNAINLAGADLHRGNFRGSTLTDADLSEANLRHARLVGADLSGAYLGNTDLSHADCHRASFALANLIGADLRQANLVGVNLSQVNLAGAELTGAKFGDNQGITPEMERDLQQRGAIFDP